MTKPSILRSIDAQLRADGFSRHGNIWTRWRRPFTDVIDLQRSRSLTSATVNVGLMHRETYEHVWGKPPGNPPSAPECIVETRIGFLLDGKDHWWPMGELSSVEEITGAIDAVVLPFIESFKEIDDVERWLEASPTTRWSYPPPTLYLAALKRQQGKGPEARALLQSLLERTKSDPWKERIRDVLDNFQ